MVKNAKSGREICIFKTENQLSRDYIDMVCARYPQLGANVSHIMHNVQKDF